MFTQNCSVEADFMHKQMAGGGEEATQRGTDKPPLQSSRSHSLSEQTVIIQGESAELHAVCQHLSLLYTHTLPHTQAGRYPQAAPVGHKAALLEKRVPVPIGEGRSLLKP